MKATPGDGGEVADGERGFVAAAAEQETGRARAPHSSSWAGGWGEAGACCFRRRWDEREGGGAGRWGGQRDLGLLGLKS